MSLLPAAGQENSPELIPASTASTAFSEPFSVKAWNAVDHRKIFIAFRYEISAAFWKKNTENDKYDNLTI